MVELLGRYSSEVELGAHLESLIARLRLAPMRREAASGEPHVHKLDHRLRAELVAQVVAEYQAGATSRQLGQSYGLSKTSVLKLVRESGGVIRPSYRPE